MNSNTNYSGGNFRELQNKYQSALEKLYKKQEARQIARIFISEISGIRLSELAARTEEYPGYKLYSKLQQKFKRLLDGEPIQYMIEYTEFMNLRIQTCPGVLIPRPETEELCQLITETPFDTIPETILDVGSGSGCISLSLARAFPGCKCIGIDNSETAIACSRKNAKLTGIQAEFKHADIFESQEFPKNYFDIIVSNPPYVLESEKSNMHKNVLDYEPATALFVPDSTPLTYYEEIAKLAQKHLKPGGYLFFELNAKTAGDVSAMLINQGLEKPMLHKDLSGHTRFAILRKKRKLH